MKLGATLLFAAGFALVVVVVGPAGCNGPRAEEATARRTARIHALLVRAKAREQERPRRVRKTCDLIRRSYQRDEVQFQRGLQSLRDGWERALGRWNERWPRHRKWIHDQLDGDLRRAHNTIPRLFY